MTPLRIEALRSLAAIAPFRAQIDALDRASRRPCPFSTYEYLETFLAHDEYGAREDELLFLAAFEGERLVGYLPLRKHRESMFGLSYGRIGMMISHDTDRPHAVARVEDERRVCDAFLAHLLDRERGWSLIELAMQDDASGLATPPRSPLRFFSRRFPNMPNSTLPLANVRSLDEYLTMVGYNERKTMRRLGRRLLSAGKVEIVASNDPRAREPLLDLYLDLERRSWKETARAGIRRDPKRVAMFRALCDEAQPLALDVLLVLLDGVVIAGIVSGAYEGGLYGLETAFDDAYEDLGPGHLLMLALVKRALDGRFHSINFDGNYAYYKSRVGCTVTETAATQIYRTLSLPWAKALFGEARRRVEAFRAARRKSEEQRFNPERRAVATDHEHESEKSGKTRPLRDAERALCRRTLDALAAEGARVDRISGAPLAASLPFTKTKEAA